MIDEFREELESIRYLVDEESIDVEFLDEASFILKGRLVFINGMTFDFREFRAPDEHDYRFHLMDRDDELVRRWDSAPHHENVETFPFHVHSEEGEVSPSEEQDLVEILRRVEDIVVADQYQD